MDKSFNAIPNDSRPLIDMTMAQVGLVLGLDKVLREAGLVLTCPRCAAEGHPSLESNNTMQDDTWKLDCRCRRRRAPRQNSMMTPSGWLLQLKDDLLEPLGLDVRCPRRRCLLTKLTLHESADHTKLVVTCDCGNRYEFSKTRKQARPH